MKKRAILTSLLFLALLLCGCAGKVDLAAGKFPADSESITAVLQPGETEKLSLFTALRHADLRGSENHGEIAAWAAEHPEVDALWSLSLPDGTVVESSIESIELPALDSAAYAEAAALLPSLPALRELHFAGALSPADFALFTAVRPELEYDCEIVIGSLRFPLSVEKLDLSGKSAEVYEEFLSVLPSLTKLRRVELGSEEKSPLLDWDTIRLMQEAAPGADFNYSFSIYEVPVTTLDTKLDLYHIPVEDQGQLAGRAMAIMPKLEYVDMDGSGVEDEDMAKLQSMFPEVTVVWRVWFGTSYSVRTDVEMILASMPSGGGEISPSADDGLYYCTRVKYLDLGHNQFMTDISFVANMPELEVGIFSIGGVCDLSPLANCKKLEFLEVQSSYVTDLSVLSDKTELRHLNIGNLENLTDISPIMDLELERLWIGCITPIPEEQVEQFKKLHPDCEVNTTTTDPHEEGWRYVREESGLCYWHPRYTLLVEQFGYDRAAYSFAWKDPLYY